MLCSGATPRASLGLALAIAPAACGGVVGSSEASRDAQAVDASAHEPFAPRGEGDDNILEGDAPALEASFDVDADAEPDGGEDASPGSLDATTSDEVALGADGLPSTQPCLAGGHVLWVEGDPGCYWLTGTQVDAIGSSWMVEAEAYSAFYDGAYIVVGKPSDTSAWRFDFNTWSLKQPMETGVVYDAQTTGTTDLQGNGQTCDKTSGTFRIDEFHAVGGEGGTGMLLSFTAAFSFTCAGSPGVLRGCIHF